MLRIFSFQAANRDYYSQYMTEDFNTYVNRKRLDMTHGNHIEIQAMCEMFNRSIEVFCYGKGTNINGIFHSKLIAPRYNVVIIILRSLIRSNQHIPRP